MIFLAPYSLVKPTSIRIHQGDDLRKVATILENEGVIYNKDLFILAGKAFNFDGNLIPGDYTFDRNLTVWQVYGVITNPGTAKDIVVVIPPGYNLRQLGRLIKKNHGLDSARFIQEAQNDSLIKILGVDVKSLEGFLYPDTYLLRPVSKYGPERDLIHLMFDNFMAKFTPDIRESIKQSNKSVKEIITMASIIQGETRHVPEMPTIAGVYYNRLNINMKLDADPTVQYSLPETKKRLTYQDYRYDSPYNTYRNKGLPPGPVGNPTIDAIKAAISPATHNYFYFVANGKGSHNFASTYAEHLQKVADYRRNLVKNKSAQPKNEIKSAGENQKKTEVKPAPKKKTTPKKTIRSKKKPVKKRR